MVDVPDGVPGLGSGGGGGVEPPLHPVINTRNRTSTIASNLLTIRIFAEHSRFTNPVESQSRGTNRASVPVSVLSLLDWLLPGAVVVIVTVAVTDDGPGVSCCGEMVHVARDGAPEHAREIGRPYSPSDGDTVTVYTAESPAAILALAGELLTPKSALSFAMNASLVPLRVPCSGDATGKFVEPVCPVIKVLPTASTTTLAP
jgi:hypothetical protein